MRYALALRRALPGLIAGALAACDGTKPTTANDLELIAITPRKLTGSSGVPETVVIRTADYTFSPNYVTVKPGGTVIWEFDGPKGHTATGRAPATFSSGFARPGIVYSTTMTAAGGYSFLCSPHPLTMTGRIEVPMLIEPAVAAPGVPVTITWASVTAPSGYQYDVQVKDPGATAFRDWRMNQTAPATTLSVSRLGTYKFRARLRRVSGNVSTSWSPEAPLTIANGGIATTADFFFSCAGLNCAFNDASVSSAALTAWSWNFGDGATATTQNADHRYASEVTRNLRFTATSAGGSQTVTRNVRAVNLHPRSLIDFGCTGLTCNFTDASFDLDGTISSWEWAFGDGSSSAAQNPTYTFASEGTYTIRLTARDELGMSAAPDTVRVFVSPDNTGPVAKFTYTCSGLTCTFVDESFDLDGTIVSWIWEFGDDDTSTAQNPTHTFPGATEFWVNLKVTDNKGAESSAFRKQLKF